MVPSEPRASASVLRCLNIINFYLIMIIYLIFRYKSLFLKNMLVSIHMKRSVVRGSALSHLRQNLKMHYEAEPRNELPTNFCLYIARPNLKIWDFNLLSQQHWGDAEGELSKSYYDNAHSARTSSIISYINSRFVTSSTTPKIDTV